MSQRFIKFYISANAPTILSFGSTDGVNNIQSTILIFYEKNPVLASLPLIFNASHGLNFPNLKVHLNHYENSKCQQFIAFNGLR